MTLDQLSRRQPRLGSSYLAAATYLAALLSCGNFQNPKHNGKDVLFTSEAASSRFGNR
jgi:hypothetical protein